MPQLTWNEVGTKLYTTGTSKGTLAVKDATGTYPLAVAWNGLTAVTESPTGAEPQDIYADDILWLSLRSTERFGATIEAYLSPEEFDECDGSVEVVPGMKARQQTRKPFAFTYQTRIGNDVEFDDFGYTIHIVYGATAAPTEKSNATVNETPEPLTLSWEVTTVPEVLTGFKPTSHLEISSLTTPAAQLAELEAILYGDTTTTARIPLPDEVKTILTVTP